MHVKELIEARKLEWEVRAMKDMHTSQIANSLKPIHRSPRGKEGAVLSVIKVTYRVLFQHKQNVKGRICALVRVLVVFPSGPCKRGI